MTESPEKAGLGQNAGVKVVRVKPLAALVVAIIAVSLFLFFFNALSTVLLGALAAAVVASTLNPLVRRFPGARGVAAAVVGLLLIAVAAGLVIALSWPLAGPIKRELAKWPEHREKINDMLMHWSERLGTHEMLTVEGIVASIGQFFGAGGVGTIFSRGADVIFGILIWLVFIFIGSIFMVADSQEKLLGPAIRVAPPQYHARLRAMLQQLGVSLRRWVIGTTVSMCIVFTASLIGYLIIGLELAVPLALLAGVAEIVPTVGPATACVIAILFAALQSGQAALGVLVVYAVIQSIEAYVILPMIMRGAVHIHPAVTLFSVVLWGKLFGVPGLMLAIPINLTVWAAVQHLYVKPNRAGSGGQG